VPAASSAPSVSSTLLSIATPMSSLAGSAFRLCYRAVRGGVRRALQLRSDWTEGQMARRKVGALMRARAEDRLRARRREEQAMKQLQELEAQIQHMQQSDKPHTTQFTCARHCSLQHFTSRTVLPSSSHALTDCWPRSQLSHLVAIAPTELPPPPLLALLLPHVSSPPHPPSPRRLPMPL
jgi:hypothetical protein